VQFSHPLAEQAQQTAVSAGETAYRDLFREPEFAPGTVFADPTDDDLPPMPRQRQSSVPRNSGRSNHRRPRY
jgi:hypothetical protein